MTIPNSQPRKSTSPPPTVHSGTPSRERVAKRRAAGSGSGSGCSGLCTLLIVLVVVGFGVAAVKVYCHYHLNEWNLHTYHDGDQVLVSKVSDDLNSVLCEQYTVSPSDPADVYLTDGPAQISRDLREVITVTDTGLTRNDNFDYRAFYLLPGSEIDLRACMMQFPDLRERVQVLIIKGDDNFRSWLGDAHCADCIMRKIHFPPLGLCSITRHLVEKEDTYYVIITRARRWDTKEAVRAEVDMKVTKTVYDFTTAKQMCHLTRSCLLNLTYGADDDVIVQFAGLGSAPVTAAYFTTECQLRRIFWATIFGVLPASITLILLTCCLLCGRSTFAHRVAMKKKKKESSRVFTVNAGNQSDSQPHDAPSV